VQVELQGAHALVFQLDVEVCVGVVEILLVVVEFFESGAFGCDVDLAVVAVVGAYDLDLIHADVALVVALLC
jgi:hypothetical protein